MNHNYEVNYPMECCARCAYSYINSYGDAQCQKQPPGSIIEFAGICDVFKKE